MRQAMPGGGRGGSRSRATGQVASRVARGAQQIQQPVQEEEAAPPTIAQVVVAQATNISMVRVLLEDLAKGVLDLSLVVGEHARTATDLQSRVAAIEQELGVEIEPDAAEDEVPEAFDDGDAAGDYDAGDYDDLVEHDDEHAEEAA